MTRRRDGAGGKTSTFPHFLTLRYMHAVWPRDLMRSRDDALKLREGGTQTALQSESGSLGPSAALPALPGGSGLHPDHVNLSQCEGASEGRGSRVRESGSYKLA